MLQCNETLCSFLSAYSPGITGCGNDKPEESPEIDEDILQEGDIVFRKGLSLTSRIVINAGNNGVYSHTGIVVKDIDDWKVIHCVPGETDEDYPEEKIKKETLKEFFAPDRSAAGAILRLNIDENIIDNAVNKT